MQSHLNLFQFFYPEPEEKRGGRWLRKMKERYAITDTTRLATGCYNLLCSGFIQINSEIAMGASISPVSAFRNSQYDISILVWKVKANVASRVYIWNTETANGLNKILKKEKIGAGTVKHACD